MRRTATTTTTTTTTTTATTTTSLSIIVPFSAVLSQRRANIIAEAHAKVVKGGLSGERVHVHEQKRQKGIHSIRIAAQVAVFVFTESAGVAHACVHCDTHSPPRHMITLRATRHHRTTPRTGMRATTAPPTPQPAVTTRTRTESERARTRHVHTHLRVLANRLLRPRGAHRAHFRSALEHLLGPGSVGFAARDTTTPRHATPDRQLICFVNPQQRPPRTHQRHSTLVHAGPETA